MIRERVGYKKEKSAYVVITVTYRITEVTYMVFGLKKGTQ